MMIDRQLMLGCMALLPAAWSHAADRPNIVLFMVDDMGWQDTSVPFYSERTALNRRFHTPNMERLAQMGMKFTNAYACSISSPSRCSLMTGMNAARHRVTNWTFEYNCPPDERDTTVVIPDWNYNGIQPEAGIPNSAVGTSFVELLRRNGYNTIHCGKAHFGARNTPAADPLNYGFNVNICGHAAGGLASYLGEQRYGHDANGLAVSRFAIPGLESYWSKDVFATEALTQEAIKALEKNRSRGESPFFLYMAHYAVHVPIEADSRFVKKYLDAGLSQTEAAYATLVEGMDKSLGDLMDYLENTGQLDNTIIIFMSDNGGLSALGRTPPLHVQNAPLRSGKGSAYEGGVREPMIVYWNGVAAPGSTNSRYVIIEDFFPSILEMAQVDGCSVPQTVDGKSFVPVIKGGSGDEPQTRALYWNTPNTWISGDYRDAGIGQTCAIRKGNYKMIYWYKDGKKELYDLSNDIGETTDLSTQLPDVVNELSRDLGNFLRGCGGQRPSLVATGAPCPWPDEKSGS